MAESSDFSDSYGLPQWYESSDWSDWSDQSDEESNSLTRGKELKNAHSKVIEAYNLLRARKEVKLETFRPKSKIIKVSEADYDLIGSTYLPDIHDSIVKLQEELDLRRLLLRRGGDPRPDAPSATLLSELIIKTFDLILKILKDQTSEDLRSSVMISVSAVKLMQMTQDFYVIKNTSVKLLESYKIYIKGCTMIEVKELNRQMWGDTVIFTQRLTGTIKSAINNLCYPDEDCTKDEAQRQANFKNGPIKPINLIADDHENHEIKLDIKFALDLHYLRNKLIQAEYLSKKYDRRKIDSEPFIRILQEDSDFFSIEYFTKLRQQLISLEDKIKPDNITCSSSEIWKESSIFELPELITENLIRSKKVLGSFLPHPVVLIAAESRGVIVSGVQVEKVSIKVEGLISCWSRLIKIFKDYLLSIKFDSEGQKVQDEVELWPELKPLFDSCVNYIDRVIKQLKYKYNNEFRNDCNFLVKKVIPKIVNNKTWKDYDSEQNYFPGDPCDEIQRCWHMVLTLFGVLLDKISRQDRKKLKLINKLTPQQKLILGHEFQDWINEHLIEFIDEYFDRGNFEEKVDKIIKRILQSLKRIRDLFFPSSLEATNTKARKIKHIIRSDFTDYLGDFKVDEQDEEQVWLKNWLIQSVLAAQACSSAHADFFL
ncbi:expressed protein [Phakopsora pachyrhizi]|uniref:Expressed protein n=1 Tax=Phakopsora pachyrhizi TaxID=170000 RepID=A0AAV0AFV2_PHAPC|nr:expressed protein [Phakopsora pachyrhizi]